MRYARRVIPVRSNGSVVFQCAFRVVWCAKYRRSVLLPPVDARLEEIVYEVADEHGATVVELDVLADRVHLLVEVDPQYGIHRLVKQMKGRSSRLLRQEFPSLKSRIPTLWTNSYFVATVGGAPLAVVEQYVEEQKGV